MAGTRWDPDQDEVRNPSPYDYEGAKRAHARGSRDHTAAALGRVEAAKKFAEAEKNYRTALAKRLVELRDAGVPATGAGDLARGEPAIAELKVIREIRAGEREAAEVLCWKVNADRRALEQLVDWSMRVNPFDAQEEQP